MALERFSAAWREAYVSSQEARHNASSDGACVFCELVAEGTSSESGVLLESTHAFVALNAYPYGSGHMLVLPRRHVAGLAELSDDEYRDFTVLLRRTTIALEAAYNPEGMNVGMNLGIAAGAGIPKHLHAHALPRWNGDTNFMTSIGEVRVLPESLSTTYEKVRAAFENSESGTRV